MKKKLFKILTLALALSTGAFAQRNCATMENLERLKMLDPQMAQAMDAIEEQTEEFINSGENLRTAATVYNIPVVVHVVYNTTSQNISDAQIQSQINILNQDFRRLNADKVNTPSAFASIVADAEINFCLATVDPNGNPTNGIIRKSTTVTSFSSNDGVKSSTTGGSNPWNTGKYLNMWVCNLGGGLLGYAQFPGGPTATDGVVMGYTCFGNTGTAQAPFNKGRTATHEVGHWLNLRHIWGDASCGSDLVSDTPTQQTSNYSCPSHPHATCSNSGDMFMNYMDYVDDNCMNSFTLGQKTRMRALFAVGGARQSLLTSGGCGGSSTTTCNVPTSLSASGVGSTTATLNWGSTGAASYSIQYKTAAATTWITTTSTTNYKAIAGLTASTSYQYKVSSVCSGTSSAYSTTGTFTTTATSTSATSSTLTLGTGTSTTANAPYGTYYMDEKCQFIITKADLTAAGYSTANNVLKSLAFNVATASSQTMNGFTIKMRHTTATSFSSTTFLSSTNLVTVYSGTKTAFAGWNTHTFSTPFTYNGVDNILVEICWDNASYTTDSYVYATTQSTYKTLYKKADVTAGGTCASTTGTLAYERPNMKLVLSSSSATVRFEPTADEILPTAENPEVRFNLFPNPTNGMLNLNYELVNENSSVVVSIFNLMGEVIKKVEFNSQSAGEHSIKMDLNENTNSLSNGIYMCSFNVDGKVQTQRFVYTK